MKKIIAVLLFLLCLNSIAFAKETRINVIYLHGSNQDNLGGAEAFKVWMNRFHADLKKNFEKNSFMKEHLLKDAYINEEPEMIYWGGRLHDDKAVVEAGLKQSEKASGKFPQFVRRMIAEVIHDAVWLQKNRHIAPVMKELNDKVIENYKNGEKTILVGYSAGTFITLNYMFTRTPSINLVDTFKSFNGQYGLTNNDILLAKKYANQNTCTSAALKSKVFDIDKTGTLVVNPNVKDREAGLKQIKQDTELACAPVDAVSGVLNFGAPIAVFYSELSEEEGLQRYVVVKTMQNLVENGNFFLTANYSKDPIAVPLLNFTYEQIANKKESKGCKNGGGFIYDTIVRGGVNPAQAHTNYWFHTNGYTKAVAKSYEKGYKYFYNK